MQVERGADLQRRTLRTLMVGVLPAGAAMAGGYAAAAVLAKEITGSGALAGLAAACLTLGSALATVPLSRAMARRGRRYGLRWGWIVAAGGAGSAFLAAVTNFYPLLLLGILGIGVGNATNLSARFAAADLAQEEERARAIGLLVWAGTFGSVLGPTLALGWAGRVSEWVGLPELAGPYLMAVCLFLVSAWVIERRLHPDPLIEAGGLEPTVKGDHSRRVRTSFRRILTNPTARLAVAAMVVGHAVMVGVMTMTPLHMKDGDHELQIIGFVISVHIIGMYALAPLVGRLVDAVGPRLVIAAGGVVLFSGADLAAHTSAEDTVGVFAGLFLVGLGWNFGLVAGSAMLTSAFGVRDRVTIQGAADLSMTGAGAIAGLSAGLLVEVRSYHDLSHWAGLFALSLSAAALWSIAGGARSRRRTVLSDYRAE